MEISRGDMFYVYPYNAIGCEQQAGRPAIIVSNNNNNKNSDTVEIVFLTTQTKTYIPTHVTIRSSPKVSTALCEQVHSVAVERLGDWCGKLNENEMQQIDVALLISLSLDDFVPEKTPAPASKSVPVQAPELEELRNELHAMTAKYEVLKELYDSLLVAVMQRGK